MDSMKEKQLISIGSLSRTCSARGSISPVLLPKCCSFILAGEPCVTATSPELALILLGLRGEGTSLLDIPQEGRKRSLDWFKGCKDRV